MQASSRRPHRHLRFESVESRLLLASNWTGLDQVRAQYGLSGQGQTVAVIDSGVDYRHEALGGSLGTGNKVVGGFDFAENDSDPYDDGPLGGHGTHVAGIIAGTSANCQGVAAGADLVALRVIDDQGESSLGRVDEALRWVHEHRNDFRWPITTVNISLATAWNASTVPAWGFIEGDLAQLEADGIFIAVAGGNSFAQYHQPGVSYPAASPHVVPVSAADADGALLANSQRDSRALVAPGRSISSSVPDYLGNGDGRENDVGSMSGTSEAAPFVAGASMLLREAYQKAGVNNVDEQTLYDTLLRTADMIHDAATGQDYHRINIARAIESVLPPPTVTPSTVTPASAPAPVATPATVVVAPTTPIATSKPVVPVVSIPTVTPSPVAIPTPVVTTPTVVVAATATPKPPVKAAVRTTVPVPTAPARATAICRAALSLRSSVANAVPATAPARGLCSLLGRSTPAPKAAAVDALFQRG